MGMNCASTLKAGHSIPTQPDLGRFISRDPIGFQGGLNLFNGAGANPVTMVDPSGLERELEGTPAEDAGILLDLGLTPEEVRGVLEQHQSVFRDGWAAGACTELAKATFSRMKALKAKGKLGNLTPAIWTVQKRHGMSEGIQGTQEDHHFVVLLKPSGGVGAFMGGCPRRCGI